MHFSRFLPFFCKKKSPDFNKPGENNVLLCNFRVNAVDISLF